jgi:hypothetical protein
MLKKIIYSLKHNFIARLLSLLEKVADCIKMYFADKSNKQQKKLDKEIDDTCDHGSISDLIDITRKIK